MTKNNKHDIPIPVRGMYACLRSLELRADISEGGYYGLFSEEQKQHCGSAEYESLDVPGTTVEVTMVCRAHEMADVTWKNKQPRGRVGSFIRPLSEGQMSALKNIFNDEMFVRLSSLVPFGVLFPQHETIRAQPIQCKRWNGIYSEKESSKKGLYYRYESVSMRGEIVTVSSIYPIDEPRNQQQWDDELELGEVGKLLEIVCLEVD